MDRICGSWTWTPTGGRSGLCIRRAFCFRTRWRRTSRSGIRTRRWNRSSARRGLRRRTSSSRRCRTATKRCWANRAWICPAASASGWRWRGRLLLQPPILILDDPTASVDARTENEIVSALREAMTGRTTFVVSSRLSLLRRADLILVLEDGRLAQSGTHEELVHLPGPYHETALLQIMDLDEGRESKAEGRGPVSSQGSTEFRPTEVESRK